MTAPQLSPEWFAARANRITGSMVGAILGVSPFMSRDNAMRSMVRAAHNAPSEFQGNVATAWGNTNEANAVLDYEMDSQQETQPAGFVEYEDFLGASPDRYVGDKGLLEIKCPFSLRQSSSPVPFKSFADQPSYYAQAQIQLLVTGKKWLHAYQWTPVEQKLETIFPDNDWLADALPRLRQFYAEFLHERDHNSAVHLEPLRTIIDTPAALKMVQEYDDLVEAIERATERKKELLAEMASLSGERNAEIGGRKLTRVEKAGAVSYAKAIKALAPDADLSAYTGQPSSFWKLS